MTFRSARPEKSTGGASDGPSTVFSRASLWTLLLLVLCAGSSSLQAQDEDSKRGWLWQLRFYGYSYPRHALPPDSSGTSPGSVRSRAFLLLNNIGYQQNRFLSYTVDVPFYFVTTCQTDSTGTQTCGDSSGPGDTGLSLRLTVESPLVDFYSIGTAFVPTGDKDKGFGTGAVTAAWTNTLTRDFFGTAPFVTLIVANSLLPTSTFVRPFSTKGLVYEVQAGVERKLLPKVRAGGMLYLVYPKGSQKTFGRFRTRFPLGPGFSHPMFAPQQGETTGTADLTEDNGGSLWVRFPFHRRFELQVAYTRSVQLNLNVISYGLFLDFTPLFRRP